MYNSACKIAEKEGVVVLHGSRGIFHNDKHPTFRSVYKAIEDVSIFSFFLNDLIFFFGFNSMTGKMICIVDFSCRFKRNWMLRLVRNVVRSNMRFHGI